MTEMHGLNVDDGVQIILSDEEDEAKEENDNMTLEEGEEKKNLSMDTSSVASHEEEEGECLWACSVCDGQLDRLYEHPYLAEVAVCKPCKEKVEKKFKSSEQDNDHCHWCGKRGDLFLCDEESCPYAFCEDCISGNLDPWYCLKCDGEPLADVRRQYKHMRENMMYLHEVEDESMEGLTINSIRVEDKEAQKELNLQKLVRRLEMIEVRRIEAQANMERIESTKEEEDDWKAWKTKFDALEKESGIVQERLFGLGVKQRQLTIFLEEVSMEAEKVYGAQIEDHETNEEVFDMTIYHPKLDLERDQVDQLFQQDGERERIYRGLLKTHVKEILEEEERRRREPRIVPRRVKGYWIGVHSPDSDPEEEGSALYGENRRRLLYRPDRPLEARKLRIPKTAVDVEGVDVLDKFPPPKDGDGSNEYLIIRGEEYNLRDLLDWEIEEDELIKSKKLKGVHKIMDPEERIKERKKADPRPPLQEMKTVLENDTSCFRLNPGDISTPAYALKKISDCLTEEQRKGIRFMWERLVPHGVLALNGETYEGGNGGILAHECGSGKTLQVITVVRTLLHLCAALKIDKIQSVLIAVPTSLLYNWRQEFHKWLDGDPLLEYLHLYDGDQQKRIDILHSWKEKGGVLIITHGKLKSELDPMKPAAMNHFLHTPGPDMLFIDEAHVLRDGKSQLNGAISSMRTRRRIALTGTPVQNHLEELFHLVDFVQPGHFGSYGQFRTKFIRPIEEGRNQNSTKDQRREGKKSVKAIYDQLRLGTIMSRSSPNPQLGKTEYVILTEPTPLQKKLLQSLYDEYEMRKDFFLYRVQELAMNFHPAVWQRQCRSAAEKSKKSAEAGTKRRLSTASEATEEMVISSDDDDDDDVMMVDPLGAGQEAAKNIALEGYQIDDVTLGSKTALLMEIIQATIEAGEKILNIQFLRIDGNTLPFNRQSLCNKFNAPNCQSHVFLLMAKSCNSGFNMQAANRIILLDTQWNPMVDAQAIARALRIGQTRHVKVYRFVAKDTSEMLAFMRQILKEATAARVLDRQEVLRSFNWGEFDDFLRRVHGREAKPKKPPRKRPRNMSPASPIAKFSPKMKRPQSKNPKDPDPRAAPKIAPDLSKTDPSKQEKEVKPESVVNQLDDAFNAPHHQDEPLRPYGCFMPWTVGEVTLMNTIHKMLNDCVRILEAHPQFDGNYSAPYVRDYIWENIGMFFWGPRNGGGFVPGGKLDCLLLKNGWAEFGFSEDSGVELDVVAMCSEMAQELEAHAHLLPREQPPQPIQISDNDDNMGSPPAVNPKPAPEDLKPEIDADYDMKEDTDPLFHLKRPHDAVLSDESSSEEEGEGKEQNVGEDYGLPDDTQDIDDPLLARVFEANRGLIWRVVKREKYLESTSQREKKEEMDVDVDE